MSQLFSALTLRQVTLPNRISMAPMCQYSAVDGFANEWHFVHLASRAAGGVGLIVVESTGVTPEGRISYADLGLWKDEHIAPLKRITHFIEQQGSVPGIQLNHAGRKASTWRPWDGKEGTTPAASGGWNIVAPSAIAFSPEYDTPKELTVDDIKAIQQAFVDATQRAVKAGFKVIEIHAAHGYLAHQFLSPLSNHRTDSYGGSFENRTRFLRELVVAMRKALPDNLPLIVRLSATDWTENGWSQEESIQLCAELKKLHVDLVDVSTGGNIYNATIQTGPGYQTEFAAQIKQHTGIVTSTVGEITDPIQAEHILRSGQADLITIGRQLLRDPYWATRAAKQLGADNFPYAPQYQRAGSRHYPLREDVNYDALS